MARRRVKKRTHVGANDPKDGSGQQVTKSIDRSPKSMVIRIGAAEVGPSVSQLVKDTRMMMQPDTAIRLKERKNNRLRDYTTMTGPLGVTHLMLFSRSATGNTNMRLAITPRGPTLHFKVEKYSLCKDVLKSQRHPRSDKALYLKAPLLVMNNFMSPANNTSASTTDPATEANATTTNGASTKSNPIPKHLEQLVTTIFQSIFPPLNPQQTPLSGIKRVMLMNREPQSKTDPDSPTYILNLRHYAIATRTTGLPKAIKRLQRAGSVGSGTGSDKGAGSKRGKTVPNLGRLDDVADWMLDPSAAGYTSGSDSEPETDGEVEVLAPKTRSLSSRKGAHRQSKSSASEGGPLGVERRAVRLAELGPRMKLRLVKVEEGLCEGRVMWHEFIHLSKEAQAKQDKEWEVKRAKKEERKKVQMENLAKKKAEKDAKKGEQNGAAAEDKDEDEDDEGFWDSDALEYQGVEDEEDDGFEDVEDDEEEMEDGDEDGEMADQG